MSKNSASSLQSRLLVPLFWLCLGYALMAAVTGFLLAGRAAELAFDRILADDARVLSTQVHWDETGPSVSMDSATAASLVYDSMAPSHFSIQTSSGKLLIGDMQLKPPKLNEFVTQNIPQFENRSTSKGELRVVSIRIGDHIGQQEPVWILVAEDQLKREQMSAELAKAIFAPALLMGFILLPLLVFGIRSALKWASRTSDKVMERSLNDLTPLPLWDVPEELRPFVIRINALLEKLQATLAHERQFIAEAAHQLRTPISGIRLLSQDLMRTEKHRPGSPVDKEVLAELDAASSRATHLVQKLLSLARAEAGAGGQRQIISVESFLESLVSKWQRNATEAGKSLSLAVVNEDGLDLQAMIDPMVLQDAVENIIENALLHGGNVCTVTLKCLAHDLCIEIADDGPLLSKSTLQRMCEPFWRSNNVLSAGSGLGLPIAEKAAAAFGGRLEIMSEDSLVGTRISMYLPLLLP